MIIIYKVETISGHVPYHVFYCYKADLPSQADLAGYKYRIFSQVKIK